MKKLRNTRTAPFICNNNGPDSLICYNFKNDIINWEINNNAPYGALSHFHLKDNILAISPDTSIIIISLESRRETITTNFIGPIDANSGEYLGSIDTLSQPRAVGFSPDGTRLFVASPLEMWDIGNPWDFTSWTRIYKQNVFTVSGMACSPDGKTLVLYGPDSLELHDAETGARKVAYRRPSPRDSIFDVVYSADEIWMLTRKTLERFRASDLALVSVTPLEQIEDADSAINAGIFSKDGLKFAIVPSDKPDMLVVYSTATLRPFAHLTGHKSNVYNPIFSGDGKRLVSYCKVSIYYPDIPHSVILWNVIE
jgi:WD40 repeat protein